MDKEEQKKVLFFRKENKHYYKHGESVSEVNTLTINLLKKSLTLPYKVEFVGLPRAQIARIISNLRDTGVEVKGKIGDATPNHALHYIITFSEKKNTIEVIRIPYISNFYGRSNNINPYTIIDLNGKKVLLEVTKDYAKQNDGIYYFLVDDLTDQERVAFDAFYTKLEYDYLYKMYDGPSQNSKQKIFLKDKRNLVKKPKK